jgi:hypothetical protein
LLYLAKKYAKGIPKRDKSDVEIVAEIKLKINALSACGLVSEDNSTGRGSANIKIVTSGYAI